MSRLSRNGAVALLLALAAAPAGAQTNGFVLQCMSARAAGRGCVTRAQTDLPTSLFRDPAGIVAIAPFTFEANAAAFMPTLTFDNAVNADAKGARHAYPLASVAFVGPELANGLHWAVGLEPIGGFGSDFTLRHALLSGETGPTVDYESFFAAVKFGPTVAYELAPGLGVGVSVSGVYAQIRDFRMPFTMDPSFAKGMGAIPQLDPPVYGPLFQQFTEMTAYGDSKGYSGLTWGMDVGVTYHGTSGWAVSASWSPERTIALSGGTATIDMGAQFQQMLGAMVMARAMAYGETPQEAQNTVMAQMAAAGVDLAAGVSADYAAATDLTVPATFGAGASVPVSPWARLSAEVEWRKWSSAESTMPFRLSAGDNPNLNLLVNADPTNASFEYPFPLQWQDSWTWKVGGEFSLPGGHAVRAGYMRGKNPVPANTVFIAFPAISTQALSVGTGVRLGGFPLDISYVHALDHAIVGTSGTHLLGAEYVGSRTTMKQDVFTLGTSLHF